MFQNCFKLLTIQQDTTVNSLVTINWRTAIDVVLGQTTFLSLCRCWYDSICKEKGVKTLALNWNHGQMLRKWCSWSIMIWIYRTPDRSVSKTKGLASWIWKRMEVQNLPVLYSLTSHGALNQRWLIWNIIYVSVQPIEKLPLQIIENAERRTLQCRHSLKIDLSRLFKVLFNYFLSWTWKTKTLKNLPSSLQIWTRLWWPELSQVPKTVRIYSFSMLVNPGKLPVPLDRYNVQFSWLMDDTGDDYPKNNFINNS